MSVMLSDKIQSGLYRGINGARASYAALAVGVVGAGTAALGAYNSSQQQKNAYQSIPDYQPVDYSGTIDYLNGNYSIPNLTNYAGTPYDTGYGQYLQAGNKYAGRIGNFLEKTNDRSNQQYRQDLFGVSPTLRGNIGQQGTNTASFLRGEIPLDVQNLVRNNAAQTSLTGGFGGSQMARNLVARDLGITSLDLIGRGNQGLQQQLGFSQALSPYQSNTLDYLMNPAQLQQNQVGENRYINQSANSNAQTIANAQNVRAMAIANLMADQASQDATGANTNANIAWQRQQGGDPGLAALFTGLGSLSSLYGSGGFGGASGNTGPANFNYSQSLAPYLQGFGNNDISQYL